MAALVQRNRRTEKAQITAGEVPTDWSNAKRRQKDTLLSERAPAANGRRYTVGAQAEHVFSQQEAMGRIVVRTIGVVRARLKIRMMNLLTTQRGLARLKAHRPPVIGIRNGVSDRAGGWQGTANRVVTSATGTRGTSLPTLTRSPRHRNREARQHIGF